MKKTITLNTEPHEVEIGPHTLFFQPEMYGDEFLDAYGRLLEVQRTFSDDTGDLDGDRLRNLYGEMRGFLARLMTQESAEIFSRFEVIVGDTAVSVHMLRELAETAALEHPVATVVDKSLRLPDRILVELMEWAVEIYGGGNRPTGSSNGSAPASSKAGTPGRGPSSSRASTRAGGR